MTSTVTLSLGQERLWFLDQLTPGDASYNIPIALSVRGPFDRDVFRAALADVTARHETLRTVVRDVDGTPVGALQPPGPAHVEHVDLSAAPEADAHARAITLTAEWSNQPFDLAHGPLIRAATAQIGRERHVLSVVVHHIAADGWSMGVLFRELTACYEARAAGATPQLPALTVTYQQVARRQRRLADSAVGAERLAHWVDKLTGAQVLQLPTDRARPAVKTSHGAFRSIVLPAALMLRVQTLARACRVTPFMVCLTVFQILLSRWSGQRDFCVGSSISGRDDVDVEPLVGLFSNTLALRSDLTGDLDFRELVRRVRGAALEAFSHQDIPFEQLLTSLQVERDLSRSPIFDVMFTMQNLDTGAAFCPAGLSVTQFEAGIQQAKYDLAVEIWANPDPQAGGELSAQFNYNTDLYDDATIERMAGHYRTLLENAVANPDEAISALDMLPPEERHRLAHTWNSTAMPLPDEGTLATTVRRRAAQSPHTVAVVSDGRAFSYADLVTAAETVADRLHAADVGPDDLVGLCVPRSFPALAGILGVWLAGAGYVPLDAEFPAERLRFMAADSGVRVLLTDESLRDRCSWHSGDLVSLDGLAPPPATDRQAAASGELAGARGVAYQIYTSGSTGLPKPVAVEHRSVRNLLRSMADHVDAGPDDTWLSLTSLSFDISVLELMLPLTTGARVVLAPERDAANGRALAQLARDHGVTHLQTTPSRWQLLVAADFAEPSIVALSGGEALPAPLARDIRGRVKKLLNVYGPTETAIWSTVAEVSDDQVIHIGGPLANTRCHVLDRDGALAPVGVPGNCGSVAPEWREATRAVPRSRRNNSCPTRTGLPEADGTAPETGHGGAPTAAWSSSAGGTTR